MDFDIVGLVLHWTLYWIGAFFVGVWDAALQHPWMFLIPVGVVVLALMGSRSHRPAQRRKRRYGYR